MNQLFVAVMLAFFSGAFAVWAYMKRRINQEKARPTESDVIRSTIQQMDRELKKLENNCMYLIVLCGYYHDHVTSREQPLQIILSKHLSRAGAETEAKAALFDFHKQHNLFTTSYKLVNLHDVKSLELKKLKENYKCLVDLAAAQAINLTDTGSATEETLGWWNSMPPEVMQDVDEAEETIRAETESAANANGMGVQDV